MRSEKPVSVVIFEGGDPQDALVRRLTEVRKQVTLDTIAKLGQLRGIDRIILCTNYGDLADAAQQLGATIDFSGDGPFHFGRRLAAIIRRFAVERILYMGGASCPIIAPGELQWAIDQVAAGDGIVVMNNTQSADIVGFAPATAIDRIEPPENDNFLGFLLREAGLQRVLIPNSPRINYDLDTPTDYVILTVLPWAGPRTAAAVRELGFSTAPAVALKQALSTHGAEIALIGRVGPTVIGFLNANFAVRTRVFSEERGMKALGRESGGLVRTLIGEFIAATGPEVFFERLGTVASACLFDTRPYFAGLSERVSEHDRFCSDLGLYEEIRHPDVRRFTRAAVDATIHPVLGGHSLVSGGLWALAETVLQEMGKTPNKF
ncbi:MAG: hypothetical protein ACM3XN_03970 [Chloroflexota bacterium]